MSDQLKKMTIVTIAEKANEKLLTMDVQYNPASLQFGVQVDYARKPTNKHAYTAEHTSTQSRTLSFELQFDGFEDQTNVTTKYVQKLQELATWADHEFAEKAYRAPHKVALKWGEMTFRGHIVNLKTNYTMFLPDGTPVRATCSLSLVEEDAPVTAVWENRVAASVVAAVGGEGSPNGAGPFGAEMSGKLATGDAAGTLAAQSKELPPALGRIGEALSGSVAAAREQLKGDVGTALIGGALTGNARLGDIAKSALKGVGVAVTSAALGEVGVAREDAVGAAHAGITGALTGGAAGRKGEPNDGGGA